MKKRISRKIAYLQKIEAYQKYMNTKPIKIMFKSMTLS